MFGRQEMVAKTMTIVIVMAIQIQFILFLYPVPLKMATFLGILKLARQH
jgi:hypothetical protein